VVSFNGEIYNFAELRAELEARGAAFRGRTDTEVLLQALGAWGVEALARLDGMFALAAFDRASGTLLLARDPFGEKPLYYAGLAGGGLAFASELHALARVPGLDLSVPADALAELLMFQYVGAPRSIYRGVRKLPPGHWLLAAPGAAPRLGRYFRFAPGEQAPDARPLAQLADELEEILLRSLQRRLVADVPLGAFLSGGVDSSTICALARRRLGVPLDTFSIGFAGAPESEHETARRFAAHLGTRHRERLVEPRASEFLYGIGRLLDEPNADSSCLPTYLLSGFARESVTVALSGDGGDEMFGGYGRYYAPGAEYYSERILVSTERHIAELFGGVPVGAREHLRALREALQRDPAPPLCRFRRTDVENYLPGAVLAKVDRMSMRHALEVRTPYLNVELARFAERLPPEALHADGRSKRVLREVACRYLPRELVDLPKQGFGLPMVRWGREELLDVAGRLLDRDESRLRAMLGREPIARFLRRQRGPGFSSYQLWALAMLESWLRHHPAKTGTKMGTYPNYTEKSAPELQMGYVPIFRARVAAVSAYLVLVGLWLLLRGEIAAPGLRKLLLARRYSGGISAFEKESGHCWLAQVPGALLSDKEGASSLRLYEDGAPLGPAHCAHAEIRSEGRGRFSHWGPTVYFSTSDNSDPRTNGRRYVVSC
jgi:asparagine synthase (glutamine-hydrolysing)